VGWYLDLVLGEEAEALEEERGEAGEEEDAEEGSGDLLSLCTLPFLFIEEEEDSLPFFFSCIVWTARSHLISHFIIFYILILYREVREKEKGKKKVGPRWQVSSRGPALSCCWPVLIAILQLATIHPLPIYCSGVSLYYI
jgi:hypothetical protein